MFQALPDGSWYSLAVESWCVVNEPLRECGWCAGGKLNYGEAPA